jgi:hypothetical protein
MTPYDFRQQLDRAQHDLRTAQNDLAAITAAIALGDQGLDALLAAAQDRVAAAQARVDCAIACLPPPQPPVDDPLPLPSPADAAPQSPWDALMSEQQALDARQVEITRALADSL